MPENEAPREPAGARRFVPGEKMFSRYVLRRVLGQGGMGVVWLAWDEQLEQEVALKFVVDSLLHDDTAIERLKRETRRNLQLAHPNIVRIHDFVQDERAAAIAMEFVNGWSLWSMRVDRPHRIFSAHDIAPWIRQLISALDYAHNQAQLVHRDLKPANLLINQREQLKVSDFGVARSLGPQVTQATGPGMIYGTVGYMSPQQALGDPPSVLDDVYSLGATIYELLTSTPPFYKGEILAQVVDLAPPSMTERLHDLGVEDVSVPWVWEDTVARCLHKERAKRPQSVADVRALLERPEVAPRIIEPAPAPRPPVAVKEIIEVPPPEFISAEEPIDAIDPSPQRGNRKSRTVILALGLVFFLAAAGGGLMAWKISRSSPAKSASGPTRAGPDANGLGVSSPGPVTAGALDTSFHRTGRGGEIRDMLVQPDGRILLSGSFSQMDGESHNGVARFNDDGTVEPPGFNAQVRGTVHALALQADDRIILAGDFGGVNGSPAKTVARVSPNGRLDNNFSAGTGGDKEARVVVVQPDGKILVGGNFRRFNGEPHAFLVRLNADGSVDRNFRTTVGELPWQIFAHSDGRILLRGGFTWVNGANRYGLVQLRNDGTTDESFIPAQHFDDARTMAVQPDGKILLARNSGPVVRLNPDGSMDKMFEGGFAAGDHVNDIAVDRHGRILVAGDFAAFDGWPTRNIVRFNGNGTVDKTFQCQHDFDKPVRRVGLTVDGDILAAGNFKERLLRLHGGEKTR